MNNSQINRKTWAEFRKTGLLLFINSLLHAFGWAIVVEVGGDGNVTGCFPARVKFRGFDPDSIAEAHRNVGNYLRENAEELAREANS